MRLIDTAGLRPVADPVKQLGHGQVFGVALEDLGVDAHLLGSLCDRGAAGPHCLERAL